MKFSEVVAQTFAWLQREGRVSYRALRLEFDLTEDVLDALKEELIEVKELAVDKDGKMLVWEGEPGERKAKSVEREEIAPQEPSVAPRSTHHAPRAEAERRQLTVMFCDLVDSTALSEQLDPEDLREVVRAYQQSSAAVIAQYDGHIAQHLGDGLLVYFGYPAAHEDDAQRAVRTALGIVEAVQRLSFPTIQLPRPVQVRIGIHTGLVVIGEIGSSAKREILALGETPNIAARVQGVTEPDSVVMSTVTQRLVQGLFECQDLGPQTLKGISTPLSLYRILRESAAQSRFEVAVGTGLTPLVGREEELGLLQRRWTQAKEGAGQVVLLSGEAGIGKSRLVQALKEQVLAEGATRIEFRCSPYHRNSAFYPIIEHAQRLLQFAHSETAQVKLAKLRQMLATSRFPQADTLLLLAALLSLPQPEESPPLTLSPQKQKQKTQEALVAWIVEEAEKAPVSCAWEDLHWADPSTLEMLTFFLEQIPTTRVFTVLTFRPEFTPPWNARSYFSQLTLTRLGRSQVETMVEKVSGGKALPPEVVKQIVTKTDGVPLFVEELTKTVLETMREQGTGNGVQEGQIIGAQHVTSVPALGIPATLQDALMARLDRLGAVKEIAQVGAVLGREFNYELLHAVSSADEDMLQHGLKQLVEAELVYQRGVLPQAHYLFKHALIQDAAYQSLLKSKRQQYHIQIAHVLEERFPEIRDTQPELLAHHYTEASLIAQAIPYWQQAGERAIQRSAYVEAVAYLTKGLELLKTLPDTTERVQQELTLQLALSDALLPVKGYTASEVEKTATRARALCQQLGETPQLFPVLGRLRFFYLMRGDLRTTRELAEQQMRLAQSVQDRYLLSLAHGTLGGTLFFLGELISARTHLEQAIALYNSQQHPRSTFNTADPRVDWLSSASWTLSLLGYPDQALKRSQEAMALAEGLSHPFSLTFALDCAAWFHLLRREGLLARTRAEVMMALSSEQGFPHFVAEGTFLRGWALVEQGQEEEGVVQIRQGLAAVRAMGSEVARQHWLALLAEACGKVGRTGEGLALLAEALDAGHKSGQSMWEAELYRLKGTLTLQKLSVVSCQLSVTDPRPLIPDPQGEAEACFLKAIEIARQQQAKSLELRAVMSLVRLRQQQATQYASCNTQDVTRPTQHESHARLDEAHTMLSEIYNWFTEGFDTKDLQEAKALLESLSS